MLIDFNKNRFEISFDYDPDLVEAIKAIYSRKWRSKQRVWEIPASAARLVGEFGIDYNFKFSPSAQKALREYVSKRKRMETIPPELDDPRLFPFQRKGVALLTEQDSILADEVGVGKTPQALFAFKNVEPLLVVCPSVIKLQWQREAKIWINKDSEVLQGRTGEIPDSTPIIIMNYAILEPRLNELLKVKFGAVVFDESHYCKSRSALRTQAAIELARKVRKDGGRVVCLTGSPVLSKPIDLFSQLQIIGHYFGANLWTFGKRFCGAWNNGFGWMYDGATHLDELKRHLEGWLLRRTKREVMDDLPGLLRCWIPLQSNVDFKRLNEDVRIILSRLRASKKKGKAKSKEFIEGVTQLNEMRQLAAMSRAPDVGTALVDTIEQGVQVLLFASFLKPLDEIEKILKNAGVAYGRIDGSVTGPARDKEVQKFQAGKTRVIIGTMRSFGFGLNLQAASEVWFLDLDWTPTVHNQCEARAHRQHRKGCVTSRYFFSPDLRIDVDMQRRLEKKLKVVERLIGEESFGRMTENTILKEMIYG